MFKEMFCVTEIKIPTIFGATQKAFSLAANLVWDLRWSSWIGTGTEVETLRTIPTVICCDCGLSAENLVHDIVRLLLE